MAFLASAVVSAFALVVAMVPNVNIPGHTSQPNPAFPAPPGYVLPWAGGEIHAVTQGEDTTLTHNGLAAYAFDFDLNYDTVVASRGGRVSMVYDGSNIGGCNPIFAASTNYVAIDHGDGTTGLYLHLANASALVHPGDIVEQGQPIALSGDTGVTCADAGDGPAPHLHFQVERTEEGHYFTQSMPIAFDDVSANDGVPVENESYASGNYGRGRPQKIKLTARRAERPFAPRALPANPLLVEVLPPPPDALAWPTAAVDGSGAASNDVPQSDAPPAEGSLTETPTRTPKPTRTPTPEPPATDTPVPVPSDTPAPAPSNTPPPASTDTPVIASPSPSDTVTASMVTPVGTPSP